MLKGIKKTLTILRTQCGCSMILDCWDRSLPTIRVPLAAPCKFGESIDPFTEPKYRDFARSGETVITDDLVLIMYDEVS